MAIPTADELRIVESAALEIASRAGDVLIDRFRSALDVQFKDQHQLDPVTEVDLAVEKMVRAEVAARFPDHAVLGEEQEDSGPPDADYVWVVDPVDGTSNFINGLPMFACSIGVLWQGIPVVAALFVPTSRHLCAGVYHSRHGGGVYFNDEKVEFHPADIAPGARLSSIPGGSGGVTGPRGRRFGNARTLGSIAVELALTAEGTLQMCLFEGAKLWDVAAGAALCLESGAAVYVRSGRGGRWRPLERFAGSDEQPPTLTQLRAWREALSAGDPSVIPDMPGDLQREQGVVAVLRRLLLHQG